MARAERARKGEVRVGEVGFEDDPTPSRVGVTEGCEQRRAVPQLRCSQ